ncbi:MAG: lysophospholipid acyltransferase family protein [Lentisphaeria bacterium]|nr:lysophospholipid acyltransferase family protein [Lentisphaeria bacterium]
MIIRAVDLVLWILSALPEPVARLMGRVLGFVAYRVARFRVKTVRSQLAMAFPELDASARLKIEKDFYRHLGLTAVEILRIKYLTDGQISERVRYHGGENFQEALNGGKGVFILNAHMGNWEMAIANFASRGYDTHVVVKEINGKVGQHLAVSMREKHGVVLIARRHSIREIFTVIRNNGGVGFVLDQNMTADEGVFVDFFGQPACTMPGLAIMASRMDTPVIPMSCHRDEKGIHHVEFFPPVPWEEPEGFSRDEVIRHNTQRYTKILEDIIRRHPEQWLWIHKRWRTQPPPDSDAGGRG